MKLIVGLGNPGNEYNNTRHNIGFIIIDFFANYHGVEINKKKFNGLYGEFLFNNEKIILLKPQSYMNLSGEVVRDYVNYFKINNDDILVISDDLDMEFGRIRLKYKGSCGGHNGLRNIEKCLGTNEYKRLKFGISNNKNIDTKDYVLGKFNDNDVLKISNMSDKFISLLNDYLVFDFDVLMNKYN